MKQTVFVTTSHLVLFAYFAAAGDDHTPCLPFPVYRFGELGSLGMLNIVSGLRVSLGSGSLETLKTVSGLGVRSKTL